MNIFVGNLNYRIREEELSEAFENYGTVNSVKIIKDKLTGRSKGFAFVEMDDREDGLKAIESLNGAELGQRSMVVNEAKPRPTTFNGRN